MQDKRESQIKLDDDQPSPKKRKLNKEQNTSHKHCNQQPLQLQLHHEQLQQEQSQEQKNCSEFNNVFIGKNGAHLKKEQFFFRKATQNDIQPLNQIISDILLEYGIYSSRKKCNKSMKDVLKMSNFYWSNFEDAVVKEENLKEIQKKDDSKHDKKNVLKSCFYVLVDDTCNEIIGSVAVTERKKNEVFEIRRLYLKKSRRGNKLGAKLMKHAIETINQIRRDSKGIKLQKCRIDIIVANQHIEAIQLYKNFGFTKVEPNGKMNKDTFMQLHLDEEPETDKCKSTRDNL